MNNSSTCDRLGCDDPSVDGFSCTHHALVIRLRVRHNFTAEQAETLAVGGTLPLIDTTEITEDSDGRPLGVHVTTTVLRLVIEDDDDA